MARIIREAKADRGEARFSARPRHGRGLPLRIRAELRRRADAKEAELARLARLADEAKINKTGRLVLIFRTTRDFIASCFGRRDAEVA